MFTTHRRPGPGKVVSPRGVCPDTGMARLSYGQARALLDEHTAVRGPGAGWNLHEFRHREAENVRRYFHLSAEAIAEVPSLLAPGDGLR